MSDSSHAPLLTSCVFPFQEEAFLQSAVLPLVSSPLPPCSLLPLGGSASGFLTGKSPYCSSGRSLLDLLSGHLHKSIITHLPVHLPTIYSSTVASAFPPEIMKQSSETAPHTSNLSTSTPVDKLAFAPSSSTVFLKLAPKPGSNIHFLCHFNKPPNLFICILQTS
ncbi:hypothetical protein ATANTOWER_028194 [Ataeniobius toweri]|uniref:Uncharacterized protein n=1 Tax=Ataeniobius toweri TaxID=208326 RepID=A0ABU7AHS4_9TELE|nr:hypothetical protein [Ataeniobius toweri]